MIHKAKKSLGQNFLKSEEALRTMCEAGSVCDTDIVLEIGPGKGALTEKLLQRAKKIFAVEKDRDLIQILEEKFKDEIKNGKLEIINGDVLDFDPAEFGIKEGGYKIIANIPYNITGLIFRKFLSETLQPNTMVLLVQKEVATRIVARDKKESILSLSVKAYGTPKYVMKVGKRFFSPSPKVDSGIVSITNISKKLFADNPMLEKNYFEVIKSAFAHKRKVLRKNLESIASPSKIEAMYSSLKIDTKMRAEDIESPLWIKITDFLYK